jgi:hypothetical protein
LEATVQRVLERLQQDSYNSSRLPSSDPPQTLRKRTRRGPSGRKRGKATRPSGADPSLGPH